MKINKMITPFNHAKGTVERIKYIVIHYVGSTGSAQANCRYFMADGRKASAHYFIGHDGAVWQSVEDKDIAWHCTNRNPKCKNTNSIGIELCCRKDPAGRWYFEDATVFSAVQLTKELMAKYNVPIQNVWRHYDCTGKCCPDPFVKEPGRWEAFIKALGMPKKAMKRTAETAPTNLPSKIPSNPNTETTVKGQSSGPAYVVKPPSGTAQKGPGVGSKEALCNGWVKNGDSWYLNHDGVPMKDEWVHYKHHWYRLGPDGIMLTGWHRIPDSMGIESWCYFDETAGNIGKMWHERADRKGYLEIWTTED